VHWTPTGVPPMDLDEDDDDTKRNKKYFQDPVISLISGCNPGK